MLTPRNRPQRRSAAYAGLRLAEYWRYRIGDYRVICEIQDAALVVLVVRIGYRGKIYR